MLSAAPYLLYVAFLVAVGLSRIFILAHFPHQVIAGSITGLNVVSCRWVDSVCRVRHKNNIQILYDALISPGFALGVVLSRRVPEGRTLLILSVGLLLGTLTLHTGLQWLGINLSWLITFYSLFWWVCSMHEFMFCEFVNVSCWLDMFALLHRSISLAKKWCSHSEWIRLDTAPFSSLTRDCGALLGLGLAQYWKPGGWCLPWAPRALSLAISSMGLYHVHRLPLPVQPQGLFYGMFFVKFVIVPQIVMVLVPGLVHLFTHKKKQ